MTVETTMNARTEEIKEAVVYKEKKKYTFGTLVTQIWVLIVAFLFASPLLIILNYSFRTRRELFVGNPLHLPESFSWDNYRDAITRLDMGTTYINSIIYTVTAVLLLTFICSITAWAIARNKGFFFRFSYIYLIIGILIPANALFLPIYIVGFNLGLVDTRVGIILMYVATNLSFGIFLMTSFMSTVPIEIEEAATVDGASIYRTYFSIVLPLLKPAVATLAIIQSFAIWNEYIMTQLFVSSLSLRTITLAMASLFSIHVSEYSIAFAGITVSVIPIIILFVCLQKYFIKGMTVGAVKG